MRASVDLPEPEFADDAERLAAIDLEVEAVDRLELTARLALDHARDPGLRHVEDALEMLDLDEEGRGHAWTGTAFLPPDGE